MAGLPHSPRIQVAGGGPGGLYSAILLKKAFPEASIQVRERNRPDDTFGWGVVFSDETLGNFEAADPESFARIREAFIHWRNIETFRDGVRTVSTGHGFCGLSRRRLLGILQDRARQLGIELRFEEEVPGPADLPPADLVIAADGVNSRFRDALAAEFAPALDWRKCRFSWLGTPLPLEAFTFIFRDTPDGLFQVHAYPFERGLSTFIVECREEVWRRAGLDRADEAGTVAFCERLFAPELRGHRLLSNRSVWRSFPTVSCARWHAGRVVLIGDAAHTAHFSIGSGTKLAMEDAIALAAAFTERGFADVPAALRTYDAGRRPEVIRLQRAAQTSLEWFENSARYLGQPAEQFAFNLMTRSKRITWENLRTRDPALVDRATAWFRESTGAPLASDGSVPPPAFTPFQLRELRLSNRLVVSPMCQYSAEGGVPNDWHLVHLGARAAGGAALVITEMTDVAPEGRITPGCTGLWNDEQGAAWARIVAFVHQWTSAAIGLQLAHAGRKGSARHPWEGPDEPLQEGAWETLAPSPIPWDRGWPVPREMGTADLDRALESFVAAVRRADRAGFDLVEVHMAHGYLLSSFLSPVSNRRRDGLGGPLENRLRWPLEVFRALRDTWPRSKPLSVRISATDWLPEGGFEPADAVVLAAALRDAGADIIDVSTGGTAPEARPDYGRMYQVPFAERIRHEAGIPVMAVGGIEGVDHANTILLAGRADLCAIARAHLADPSLALRASSALGFPDAPWPPQYLAARPRRRPAP